MSIRQLIGAGVIALLTGCGAAAPPVPPLTSPVVQGLQAPPPVASKDPPCIQPTLCPDDRLWDGTNCSVTVLRCPDPTTNCCPSNGAGIYTAEDGSAGIDTFQLMITHFINNGSNVTFQGRYFDKTLGWQLLSHPGLVSGADYQPPNQYPSKSPQPQWHVVSVSEKSTLPTWMLVDMITNTKAEVIGEQLLGLKLHIILNVNGLEPPKEYVLDFDQASPDLNRPVRVYNMRWSRTGPNAQPMQYCSGAVDTSTGKRPLDSIVFQQGIDVNPLNGHVARDPNTDVVTVSCFLGAPATVYGWGYPYRGDDDATFHFDAGIHMKRASYCGDLQYYTVTGTDIDIADDKHTNNKYYNDIKPVEAQWGREGAICVNFAPFNYLRHPEIASKKSFTGVCPNRPQLPLQQQCTSPSTGGPYLADGPVTLIQWP